MYKGQYERNNRRQTFTCGLDNLSCLIPVGTAQTLCSLLDFFHHHFSFQHFITWKLRAALHKQTLLQSDMGCYHTFKARLHVCLTATPT